MTRPNTQVNALLQEVLQGKSETEINARAAQLAAKFPNARLKEADFGLILHGGSALMKAPTIEPWLAIALAELIGISAAALLQAQLADQMAEAGIVTETRESKGKAPKAKKEKAKPAPAAHPPARSPMHAKPRGTGAYQYKG